CVCIVFYLCCLFHPAGLQRVALAVFGLEIAHLQSRGQMPLPALSPLKRTESDLCESKMFSWCADQQNVFSQKMMNVFFLQKNGDVIYSKVLTGNRKVFRLEAELNASPEELHEILFFRVEEMHEWNPSVRRIKVLKHVGRNTMVTHEVSSEMAGNLIGQRDFLSVRHSSKRESRVYLGGASTRLESLPPLPGFVRAEDGPTCIILHPLQDRPDRSRFIWLLNIDVKGWLPQSLVNKALPRAQADFTKHLRRRLAAQNSENNRC
uniref:START domain-containing protein 1 n=1 Tax=Cyprinus carpio TaxID=7962 RepID=A0A8C1JR01_CYPCA